MRFVKSIIAASMFALVYPAETHAQSPPTAQPGLRDPGLMPGVRKPLAGIKSWGYQLQNSDADAIASSPYDLIVIDHSRSGDDDNLFAPDELKRMQRKPDGSRRFVIAYLSIGEAENYRSYWDVDWVEPIQVMETEAGSVKSVEPNGREPERANQPNQPNLARNGAGKTGPAASSQSPMATRTLRFPRLSAPVWLGRENENWVGNFLVRYWEKGWQDIIFGSPQSYLDRIIAAGFDGVFLDRVDAFSGVTDERVEGKADMVRFVTALAKYARSQKPGFVIVPQNAEELLLEPAYIASIDGIAKEDLLYGNPVEGRANPPAVTANSVKWLSLARKLELPVMVVEYTLDKDVADRLRGDLNAQGFISYFATKALDRLVLPDDLRSLPPPAAPPTKALPSSVNSQTTGTVTSRGNRDGARKARSR